MLQRFLDPSVLAGISGLDLVAKTVVDGFISGLHRSPDFGFSQEFAEYRSYNPGDDLRHVDRPAGEPIARVGEPAARADRPVGLERHQLAGRDPAVGRRDHRVGEPRSPSEVARSYGSPIGISAGMRRSGGTNPEPASTATAVCSSASSSTPPA